MTPLTGMTAPPAVIICPDYRTCETPECPNALDLARLQERRIRELEGALRQIE